MTLSSEQLEDQRAGKRVWLTREQIEFLNRPIPFTPDRTWYRVAMAKIEARDRARKVIAPPPPKQTVWQRIRGK